MKCLNNNIRHAPTSNQPNREALPGSFDSGNGIRRNGRTLLSGSTAQTFRRPVSVGKRDDHTLRRQL
jgi:hypothetical protein